jgi:hypothetical protein
MGVDEMRGIGRQRHRAGDEVDVDPGVHAQTGPMRGVEHVGQRIESRGHAVAARLDRAGEIGVAASTNLHEQRVEPVVGRLAHELIDAGPGGQRAAQDPQTASGGGGGPSRSGRGLARANQESR